MRRKYPECTGRFCSTCSLSSYGRDCRNNTISPLEWYRGLAEMTQAQLAERAQINIRQIQKIESGETKMDNVTLKNALALAETLGVDVSRLV